MYFFLHFYIKFFFNLFRDVKYNCSFEVFPPILNNGNYEKGHTRQWCGPLINARLAWAKHTGDGIVTSNLYRLPSQMQSRSWVTEKIRIKNILPASDVPLGIYPCPCNLSLILFNTLYKNKGIRLWAPWGQEQSPMELFLSPTAQTWNAADNLVRSCLFNVWVQSLLFVYRYTTCHAFYKNHSESTLWLCYFFSETWRELYW